jgi:Mor family transcriptional regulator
MNPLSKRNDEIYRRWKAGENYVDLAREYDRYEEGIRTLMKSRTRREARAGRPPGPNNKQLHKQNSYRDFKIVTERKLGKTYSQMAREHNLSPKRVRTIFENHERKRMGIGAYLASKTKLKTRNQDHE